MNSAFPWGDLALNLETGHTATGAPVRIVAKPAAVASTVKAPAKSGKTYVVIGSYKVEENAKRVARQHQSLKPAMQAVTVGASQSINVGANQSSSIGADRRTSPATPSSSPARASGPSNRA